MKNANQEPEGIAPNEPAASQPPSRKAGIKDKIRPTLVIIGFTLLGALIGAAIIYFAVVLPLNNQIAGLNKTIDSVNAALSANQAASIQKGEALAICTTHLDTTKSELNLARKVGYAAELMYQASSVQQALLTKDINTAGTRLSLAKKYLEKLTPLIDETTDLKGLELTLEDAIILYQARPTEAVSKLDTLIKTLHQLIESMQSNG